MPANGDDESALIGIMFSAAQGGLLKMVVELLFSQCSGSLARLKVSHYTA